MILQSGRWDEATWGAPINQHDMAGTSLLFSVVVLTGLRTLGLRIDAQDAEAYMHLWRYSSLLMGVEPELLPTSEEDAVRLGEVIRATQGDPDDDSRALTRALLDAGTIAAKTERERRNEQRRRAFACTMCRALLGDDMADKLGVEETPLRVFVPVLRRLVSGAEFLRESVPFGERRARAAGIRYWNRVVQIGLAGATAEFGLPEALAA